MRKLYLSAALAVAAMITIPGAHAQTQATAAVDCKSAVLTLLAPRLICDANKNPVGVLYVGNTLTMVINNQLLAALWDNQGLDIGTGVFSYTDPACATPPYIAFTGYFDNANEPHFYLPPMAYYDGKSLWVPTGAPTQILIAAQRTIAPGSPCLQTDFGGPYFAQDATAVPAPIFTPPFTLR
jgi:hypothetical protein